MLMIVTTMLLGGTVLARGEGLTAAVRDEHLGRAIELFDQSLRLKAELRELDMLLPGDEEMGPVIEDLVAASRAERSPEAASSASGVGAP